MSFIFYYLSLHTRLYLILFFYIGHWLAQTRLHKGMALSLSLKVTENKNLIYLGSILRMSFFLCTHTYIPSFKKKLNPTKQEEN